MEATLRPCGDADGRRVAVTTSKPDPGAALVTGASSGIGYAVVDELLRAGTIVYAGVRTDADAARLAEIEDSVRPLILDVTVPEQIAAAAQRIARDGVPLRAVVCNAGIALGGPLEFLPLERLRYQLEVNLVGALAVAQAALPMLRQTHGRLLFVGSISGRLTPPFVGPYAASKAALAALTDALRIELDASGSGISVSLFEFGSVKTPIWEKGGSSLERLEAQASPEQRRYYGFVPGAMRANLAHESKHGVDVRVVARAIARAALGPRPRERYVLGGGAKAGALVAAFLPVRARGTLMRRVMRLP
ncbi:MAG TPA: SDR family NAD(P)-dependent oxidoreductase [Candidatus Dormibacteraeota bacterium]|nr:SDR family NAD(P)-dependent oxidoreductase [Candidatus Dormibacteraeota bacterium]